MTALAPDRLDAAGVALELDAARRNGPLQTIVVPSCPVLYQRLQTAMQAREPDLSEVARIASSDVAMAATLIKAANSAAYSTGSDVQVLGQAMDRLGLNETARVMLAFLARRAIRVTHTAMQRFWPRATKRAHIMAHISRAVPRVSPDLAYTFGLFCHVGEPVMMQCLRGYAGTLAEAAARIDRSPIATENANHRTDHAVVGALVARAWKLAPEVMVAIRRHHDLDMLGQGESNPEIHTLVAAGLVAEHLTRRHEGLDADADWQRHHGAALEWLEVGTDDVADWDEALRPLLDTL